MVKKLKFLWPLAAILLSACVNFADEELREFQQFKRESSADMAHSYGRLSDDKKVSVFFGAMKMHPPSSEINDAVASQSIVFLGRLRGEIANRKGYVEAYALNNAVLIKRKNGDISSEQIEELDLLALCKSTGADMEVCRRQVEYMR